jgi:hypothetical protein
MVPVFLLATAVCLLATDGKARAQNAQVGNTLAGPGMPHEPLGGQPPAGSAPSV